MPDWLLFGPVPWLLAAVILAGAVVWRTEVRGRLSDRDFDDQRRQVYGDLYDFASERTRRRGQ